MRGCLEGHAGWVTAIATTNENPDMILSASRDKCAMVWALTREVCNYGYPKKSLRGHSHFVQDVVISSDGQFALPGSWDGTLRLWNLNNCKLRTNLVGHTGYINTVTVSPDGSLCASGGKDGVAMLWDLAEGKRLYSLDAGEVIHSLCFSPNRYWLCAATTRAITIWDLESKSVVDELRPDFPPVGKKAQVPHCVSLAWSADGATLYSGYTDGIIRVWSV